MGGAGCVGPRQTGRGCCPGRLLSNPSGEAGLGGSIPPPTEPDRHPYNIVWLERQRGQGCWLRIGGALARLPGHNGLIWASPGCGRGEGCGGSGPGGGGSPRG